MKTRNKEAKASELHQDMWTDGTGQIYIGKDWALQNDILDTKEKTQARACYRECRTCGSCANSIRDGSSCSSTYDYKAGKMVSCTMCEKFRFCDCRNGYFRNARGDAEPFTPDVIELMRQSGGKPLI